MSGRGRGLGRVLPAWMTTTPGGSDGGGMDAVRGQHPEPAQPLRNSDHPHHHRGDRGSERLVRQRSRSMEGRHHPSLPVGPAAAEVLTKLVSELDDIRDERDDAYRGERLTAFAHKYIDVEEFIFEDDEERGGVDAMRKFFVNVFYHPPAHIITIPRDSHAAYLVQFLRTSRMGIIVLYEAVNGLLRRCYVFVEERATFLAKFTDLTDLRRWCIISRYLHKKGVPSPSQVSYRNCETGEKKQVTLTLP